METTMGCTIPINWTLLVAPAPIPTPDSNRQVFPPCVWPSHRQPVTTLPIGLAALPGSRSHGLDGHSWRTMVAGASVDATRSILVSVS